MKRIDTENIKKRVFEKCGNEFTVLSEYSSYNEKMMFRHNICGKILYISPKKFLYDGTRCKYCANRQKAKSPEKFLKEFNLNSKGEYELIDSYYRELVKVRVKHKLCGKIYKVTPKDFLSGKRCPFCYGNKKKTTEEFSKEVNELTFGEYKLSSPYKGNKINVLVMHEKCGKIYKVTPHDFLQGNRCPYCKQSKGEKLTELMLTQYGVTFERQKRIPLCVDPDSGFPLRYDFYVPSCNILIEYDGIQHFKPVKHFGGIEKFKKQIKRDKVKDRIAQKNGIYLLRIPYYLTEDEVQKKIQNVINCRKAE